MQAKPVGFDAVDVAEIGDFRDGSLSAVLWLAYAARLIAVGDRFVARIVGNEVWRVRVLDGAAVGEVELARLCICEIVRGERGRGDGESHSCDGGKCEFLEHGVFLL